MTRLSLIPDFLSLRVWCSFFFLTSHGFDTLVVTEGCVDVGCCLVEEYFWDLCIIFFLKSFPLSLAQTLWGCFRWNTVIFCVCMSVCGNIWPVCVCGRTRATPVSVSEHAQSVWHVTAAWMASLQSQTAGCVKQHQPFDSLMRLKLSAVLKRVHVRNWLVWEPTFGQIVLFKEIVV